MYRLGESPQLSAERGTVGDSGRALGESIPLELNQRDDASRGAQPWGATRRAAGQVRKGFPGGQVVRCRAARHAPVQPMV